MPISYTVDPLRQRVDAQVEGEVSAEDAMRAFEAILREPDLRSGFVILSDHRRLGRNFSTDDIHRLTEWMEQHESSLHPTRWAAVVSRPTSFGLMRMLGARAKLTAGVEVGVFIATEEAEAWLASPLPAPGTHP
jgi:hypothetical protein